MMYAVSRKKVIDGLFSSRFQALDRLGSILYRLDDSEVDAIGIISVPGASVSECNRILIRSGYSLGDVANAYYQAHPVNDLEV